MGLDMWQFDMHLENDCRDVGFYKFPCPVLTVCADRNYQFEAIPKKDRPPELVARQEKRNKYMSRGTTFNFSPEQFASWSEWTVSDAEVLRLDTDHYGVKMHEK